MPTPAARADRIKPRLLLIAQRGIESLEHRHHEAPRSPLVEVNQIGSMMERRSNLALTSIKSSVIYEVSICSQSAVAEAEREKFKNHSGHVAA